MDKKYAVPEEAMKAVIEHHPIKGMLEDDPHMLAVDTLKACLEAFIRWQSENPIAPTKEQLQELWEFAEDCDIPLGLDRRGFYLTEWRRRMYLAPERTCQKVVL